MPRTKKLTTDLTHSLLGNSIHKLFSFVVVAILARYVDKSSMGEFFFAISLATVVAMVTELGTSRYLVREIARDSSRAAERLECVLQLRLPMIGLALILVNVLVFALGVVSPKIFLLSSAYVVLNDLYFAFGATLIAVRAVLTRVVTGLVGPGLLLATVLIGTSAGWSFDRLLAAHVASSVIMIAVAFWATRRLVGPMTVRIDRAAVKIMVSAALPFFALGALALVHSRLDEIMLALLSSYEDVASYAASYKLLEVSRFLIRPLTMVLFPVFVVAAAAEDWNAYRAKTRRLMLGAGAVGCAVSVVALPSAFIVVPLVFGADYQSSIAITQVLFLAAPALFVGQAVILAANALYLDRAAIGLTAAGVVCNATANFVVIPRWGALGAAWTTLTTETLLTVSLLYAVWHSLRDKSAERRPLPAEEPVGFDTAS